MEYLLEFSRREDVGALAGRFLERTDAVQGIAVDLDDLWLLAWQLWNTLPASDFESWTREVWDAYRVGDPWRAWPTFRQEFVSYPYGVDTSWRPAFWDELRGRRGVDSEPFVMIVVLRPAVSEKGMGDLRETDTGGISVRFEARPLAQLYAKPTDKVRPLTGGVSVSASAGSPGTLGGVLQGAAGKRFGLTCAHVLASNDEAHQPSPKDNKAHAARIGRCSDSSPLRPHSRPINPYDPTLNAVDAALIELDSGVASDLELIGIGRLGGVASKAHAHPNSSVEVVGYKSGRRPLSIGPVLLAYEFDFQGQNYGYTGLFQLQRNSRFHGITGTLTHPVSHGDSGGWVLRHGAHGREWLGVVVAGDGAYGYALPAETVVDWIDTQTACGPVTVC